MNSKMTTNSQLLTIEPKKKKNKLSKQLEQESQKWRVRGWLSARGGGEKGKRYREYEA